MSHHYHMRCPRCGVDGEGYNHASDALISAIRSYPALKVACDAGWDVSTFDGYMQVARFLLEHAPHGDLEVCSEYGDAEYPPVRVPPAPAPDIDHK